MTDNIASRRKFLRAATAASAAALAFPTALKAEESRSFFGRLFGSAPSKPARILDTPMRTDRKFAFGFDHALLVTPSGKLVGWGSNHAGELGQAEVVRATSSGNTTYSVKGPRFNSAVVIANDVVSTVAGDRMTFFLKSDGTVWVLGLANYHRLGLPIEGMRPLPGRLESLSDIVDLTAGEHFGAAIRKDGAAFVWGYNFSGELGIFLPGFIGIKFGEDIPTPTQLMDIAPMVSVVASRKHLYFLDADGNVHSPTHARSGMARRLEEEWVQFEVGGFRSLYATPHSTTVFGITHNGDVYAWGDGRNYGHGLDEDNRRFPVLIPELKGAKQIGVGNEHAIALMANGTVIAWGANGKSQLGVSINQVTSRPYPDPVPGVSGVQEVYAGLDQSAALTEQGRLLYWGTYGPLRDAKHGHIMYVDLNQLEKAPSYSPSYKASS